MKRHALIYAALLSLAAPAAAVAADANGDFAVFGAGARTCAEFRGLVDSKSADALLFIGWFQGYVSRANRAGEGVYSVLPVADANASATLLYRVCANNPSATLEGAADSLIQLMQPMAVGARSETVKVTDGTQTLDLWQSTMVIVQQQLALLGFYQGEADGILGPGTSDALLAFQKSRGLRETGIPDIDTLAAFLKILKGEG